MNSSVSVIRAGFVGILLLASTLGLTACAALGGYYEKPELTLIGIEAAESGPLEQRFRLRFRLLNPNPTRLPVRGVRYKIDLLGETFASGATSEDFNLDAFGDTEFEVTVGVGLFNATRIALAALRASEPRLVYRLEARIATTIPFLGDVRVIREGVISSEGLCADC